MPLDEEAEFGLPDKTSNFKGSDTGSKRSKMQDDSVTKKMAIEISSDVVTFVPNKNPEILLE